MLINTLSLLFLLLTICLSSWTQEDLLPTASCNIETVCRTPSMVNDYKYNGIARSGYLKVENKQGSALAFSFYGKIGVVSIDELKNYPTIIYLNGGPGRSSQFGNLRGVGPYSLTKTFSAAISDNKWSWAKEANLLFIDQPVGTGVSCLASNNHIPTTMNCTFTISIEIVTDFYKGLTQLFNEEGNGCFNSKNLRIPASSSIYLFGEGYAGKYVSAIASKILAESKAGGAIKGLKGVGIGNGFNAPMRIFSELGNFAFSMSLVDYQERERLEKMILKADFDYEGKQWSTLKTGFEKAIDFLHQRSGINPQDITKDGLYEGTKCLMIDLVKDFFTNKTNLAAFGFETSITFTTQSSDVYNKLGEDFMKDDINNVENLLNQGIAVLIYQGQDDAYVNNPGAMKWVDELTFTNSHEFRHLNFASWKHGDTILGSKKASGKLSYMVINNAGHYVPQDNPEAAYYMMSEFIKANK